MGLDFYVVKVKKGYEGTVRDVTSSWDYNTFQINELCYGRKCWELVHELHCDTQDECMSELTLENWINLQEKLAPIGPSLERIWCAYDADMNDHANAEDKWLMNQYEKWFDSNFDDYPQLGYDFSVNYMNEFWKAADNVLKYLEDPNWEVWMIASY